MYFKSLLTLAALACSSSLYAQNRLESTGMVGVGTLDPTAPLTIHTDTESKPNGVVSEAIGLLKLTRAGSVYQTYNEAAEFRMAHGGPTHWGSRLDLYINGSANQNSIPDQHAMTWQYNGNVGIGTSTPAYKFQIAAGHSNTNMNLHFDNANPVQDANLTLWASEPGLTYTGAGIGNNVYNTATVPGIGRINDLRGASYIRLLDQEIRLNVIKADGTDLSAMAVDAQGNIGMGTLTPKEKLSVNGNIRAKEVKVEGGNWPDFVFEADYKISSLAELEKYFKTYKHLPDMPSAKEVSEQGVELGEMNRKLLQKIEELTIYLIEKDKKIDALIKRVEQLEDQKK